MLAFVAEHNKANKRGGQKAAAEEFGVSALTISNWLKAPKKKAPVMKAADKSVAGEGAAKKKAARKRPGRKPAKKAVRRGRPAATGFSAKLRRLAELHDQIAKAEAALAILRAEFSEAKAAI